MADKKTSAWPAAGVAARPSRLALVDATFRLRRLAVSHGHTKKPRRNFEEEVNAETQPEGDEDHQGLLRCESLTNNLGVV